MIHDNVSNIIIMHVRVRRAFENHVQVSDIMDGGGGEASEKGVEK